MKRISVMLLAVVTLAVATIGCNNAGAGGGDPKAVCLLFLKNCLKRILTERPNWRPKKVSPLLT